MVLTGHPSVGALDLLGAGTAVDTEDAVVVSGREGSRRVTGFGVGGGGFVGCSPGEDPRQVAGDSADRGDRSGVVHPGGSQGADPGHRLPVRSIAGGDDRGLAETDVLVLVPDPDRDPGRVL